MKIIRYVVMAADGFAIMNLHRTFYQTNELFDHTSAVEYWIWELI